MRFRLFGLILSLLFINIAALAQREELTIGAPPKPSDTTKVNGMLHQISRIRETDPAKATKLCLEAISLSKQLGFHKGIGRATGSLGWIYFRRGDFVRALEYSIEALKISEKIGDSQEASNSLNNMAAIEFEEKQNTQSIKHLMKALALADQTGDSRTIARTLNNIGYIYLVANNNSDSAELYASRALKISEETDDKYSGAYSNNTIGMLYAKNKDLKNALKYYFRSMALAEGVSNSLIVETRNQIAETYLEQNRVEDAARELLLNIEVARKFGYRDVVAKSYQLLSKSYQATGKTALALEYLNRYITLHDSLHNEQSSMTLATFQSQFDLDLKEAQISLLTKDTLLNKKEISQQRIQLYGTVGGLLAIMLIATLLFYANRKINQSNTLLEKQKGELGDKNREVELKSAELEIQAEQLARLNSTKDKLFSIIGHDFRSPLNSLKAILALVENRNLNQQEFASIVSTLRSNVDVVSTNLENLLQWSMAQLNGIKTNPVRVNVPALVEEHVSLFNELAKAKNIELKNEISENLSAMADEDHARLVLRNLINNAIKFTRPGGVVRISSREENSFVRIQVSDTGVGIESAVLSSLMRKEKLPSREGTNNEKGVGLGLMLCQEFVENNGGQLFIVSEPGKGSVFSFTLKAA